jgi:probable phosphoglycerate mutase
MKIIFVRHGATASNKLGRIMSRTNDEPLNEEGLLEVQKIVAENAPNLEYDIIFASPLKRASETAYEFARAKNLEVIHHENMLEREFGILSNKTWEEVDQTTGGGLNYEIWQKSMEHDLSPYGGETKESVRERVLNFIDHLKENHKDKKPLVVTHGGVLRTLYALFPNHTPKSFKNVSIHEFEV